MSNFIDITADIKGLIPDHEYIYEFYGSANWPLVLTPITGSFTATDDYQPITTTAYFCPTPTACNSIEGLIACTGDICGVGQNQFGFIGVSYHDISYPNDKYYSNFVRIDHSGYQPPFPSLEIVSSGTIDTNVFSEYEKIELMANVQNLITNETYYYEFRNLDDNYSSIIMPSSGYFTAYSGQQKVHAGMYLANDNQSSSSGKIGDKYFSRVDFIIKTKEENLYYSSNTVKVNFLVTNPKIEISVPDNPNYNDGVQADNDEFSGVLALKNEYRDIVANITGIIPNEQYGYLYSSVGSNWPTIITEKSGTFRSTEDSFALSSILYFCPTTNACTGNPNLLTWNSDLSAYDTTLFTNLKLQIYPINNQQNISYSNTIGFRNTTDVPSANLQTSPSGSKNTEQTIAIDFDNLRPNKLYNYYLYSIEANWPFAVSRTSGSFYAADVTHSLELVGSFCENSGVCPKNSYGVLDFEAISPIKTSWYRPHVSMRLSFEDADFTSLTYYSNVEEVVCSDCVPMPKSVNISINNIPDC